MIRKRISSGSYISLSDVVYEALRLMAIVNEAPKLKLQLLREEVRRGLASGRAVKFDPETIKHLGHRMLAARKEQKGKGELLVRAEGSQGVGAHGAAGGDVAGEQGDSEHEECDGGVGEWVAGRHAIKLTGEQPGEAESSGETECSAGE